MDVLPYTVPVGSDEAVVTGVVFGTEKNKTQTHMSQWINKQHLMSSMKSNEIITIHHI